MIDSPRIGIVFRNDKPRFFQDAMPEAAVASWDFFPEEDIVRGLIKPSRGFLAVFFPGDDETPEIRRHLSAIFPGAEMVPYRQSATTASGGMEKRADGRLSLDAPVPFSLIRLLLETLSGAGACRMETGPARQRVEDERDFFDAFVETVAASSDSADRKQGMILLLDKIRSRVKAEECILYLSGDGAQELHRACSAGNLKNIEAFERHANISIIENVFFSGQPHVDNNCAFELNIPFGEESISIRSMVCYPIICRGEKAGVIELLNKAGGAFDAEDRSMVEAMLKPLSVAIGMVKKFEASERLVVTDDLTGLYNYRYLKKFIEADVKRCLRYKKTVSLLFIDVDGFKKINDTFGHLAGSRALAEIGLVFKHIVRETDVVGRYGGDEFVIILPETTLNGAMVIAERIRKKVEECEFVPQDASLHLTVSVGVANCPKHTMTAEGLIKKADAAMYRAKELSKNNIKAAV